jgi:DNA-binding NtrC family response regulator
MDPKGKVLVVDDEASLRLLLSKELGREGYVVEVVSDGESALKRMSEDFFHVVLLDIVMPNMNGIAVLRAIKEENIASEVIVLTGNATIESAIECMKLGAFEYVRKPYLPSELLIHVERAMEHQRSQLDITILKEELKKSGYRGNLVGKSKAMAELRGLIERVAPTQSTVLILGDSGTGKELVARSIHEMSTRKGSPFVAINCASLSETLLESELFGYEKGAFTDAKAQKRGLAEIADGGTLFLDEVGEIPVRFQSKLLRFLETSEIRRVGGTKDIRLNVRIICATNKPLEELVKRREFRDDLYYRLNVLSISVPPLRLRADDIPLLITTFLNMQGFQKEFDKSALDVFKAYDWPGNVRELKNLVERVCIMIPKRVVSAEDLTFMKVGLTADVEVLPEPEPVPGSSPLSLHEMERRHIIAILKHVKGHKGKAAELLQINPKTLYNKMRTYSIVSVYE